MLAADLGERLLALCSSKENNYAEVKELLESLPEDQRRDVLRSKDKGKVSGSLAGQEICMQIFAAVVAT